MASVWELCELSAAQTDSIRNISQREVDSQGTPPLESSSRSSRVHSSIDYDDIVSGGDQGEVDELKSNLGGAEMCCRNVLNELDSILGLLEDVANEYEDVTSRTNSLIHNCESVLDQQRQLEVTVEKLKGILGPFNEMEQVAVLLGVPFDPNTGTKSSSSLGDDDAKKSVRNNDVVHGGGTVTDPRSPEFRRAMHRLAKASLQVDQQQADFHFKDADKYRAWLTQLQKRALGLISRGIHSLLDGAAQQATDLMNAAARQRKLQRSSSISVKPSPSSSSSVDEGGLDNAPLESRPVYKKFRGLGFRVRELVAMLEPPAQDSDAAAAAMEVLSPSSSPVKKRRDEGQGQEQQEEAVLTLGGLAEASVALRDVTSAYVSLRQKLLAPFMDELLRHAAAAAGLHTKGGGGSGSGRSTPVSVSSSDSNSDKASPSSSSSPRGGGSLCGFLRQSYSTLHRVVQLELQLYESLFVGAEEAEDEVSPTATSTSSNNSSSSSSSSSTMAKAAAGVSTSNTGSRTNYREALAVAEMAANIVSDVLRPLVIRETSVDELCRVITVLSEDVRSHTINARLPIQLRKELLRALDKTVCDAQERLNFCAELALRSEVTKFTPLPSHVAYPDLLEEAAAATAEKEKKAGAAASGITVNTSTTTSNAIRDVSRLWYPSLRGTLSLLSKLYGVVEAGVFEDFARRSVEECVQSLRRGAAAVAKKGSSELVAALFLVRHLLVLREQLLPFDIRLQGTEKRLDFSSTGEALSQLRGSLRDTLKFNRSNGLLKFAREGLPTMQESVLDVKGELDRVLKLACGELRDAALKMLVGSELEGLLAKVQAFAGDIPVHNAHTSAGGAAPAATLAAAAPDAPPALAPDVASKLRNQAFLRPERLLSVLNDAQGTVEHTLPELKRLMALFIDSSVARAILLKPVQQDLDLQRSKLLSVVMACVDAGQARRDIEQLAAAVHDHVSSELLN